MSKQNRVLFAGRDEDKNISKKLFSNFRIFEHFFRNNSVENGTIERGHLLLVNWFETIFFLSRLEARNVFAAAVKFDNLTEICLSNIFLHFVEHFFEDLQIGISHAVRFALFSDVLVQNESRKRTDTLAVKRAEKSEI